jgi:hypothetical protein
MLGHPDFLYDFVTSRQRELRAEAAQDRLARMARGRREPRNAPFAALLAALGRGMVALGGRLERLQSRAARRETASTTCMVCGSLLDGTPRASGAAG